LNLKCDILLSKFAFKFISYRYTKALANKNKFEQMKAQRWALYKLNPVDP
jgi:hypothetical protein